MVENSIPRAEALAALPTDERMREVLDKLQQGTEAVLTGEGFAKYLKSLSYFHNYSWSNTILITMQRPDATLVNSYDRWKAVGRQVNKGEKGIKIFFPIFPKKTELQGEDVAPARFGIGNVFDVSQTSGEPLPERPTFDDIDPTETTLAETIQRRLESWLTEKGVTLRVEAMELSRGGYFRPSENVIAINRNLSLGYYSNAKARIMVHEAAHYIAGHSTGTPREDAESVAEGSAYATLYHFGYDLGATSFTYLANWAKDMAVLKRNLANIQTTTHTLITAIEGGQEPFANVRRFANGVDRNQGAAIALREQILPTG